MINKINGQCYRDMLDYGMRNLYVHCKVINRLNVFPVPDGDTGTNMAITIKNALGSINGAADDLPSLSRRFANSVVFGARGNSGVIVSQFLKGFSELFFDVEFADSKLFVEALERGVEYAWVSVAKPVEGTILTVIKDATNAVKSTDFENCSIDEVISVFIKEAKISLDKTPELLPALKEAGVVDSGGAGIVYFFEGIKKYLDGEVLVIEDEHPVTETVDYTAFNRNSRFEYGYCTELLVQLLNGRENFDKSTFLTELEALGDSVALTVEDDKVRVHVHTKSPERVFELCHRYGEFLTLKVENMTVQHTETVKNILCSPNKNDGAFSVVAIAYDRIMQKLFLDMGADVVVYCKDSATTKDYIDAFEHIGTKQIIVFPNSADSTLTAIQAKKLYKNAEVTVINSRSVAECYASLPIVDFAENDVRSVVDLVTETINRLYVVSVAHHKGDQLNRYGAKIAENEYYAFSGKEIISVGNSLNDVVIEFVADVLKKRDKEIITFFYSKECTRQVEEIVDAIGGLGFYVEVYTVPIENLPCEMTVSFE